MGWGLVALAIALVWSQPWFFTVVEPPWTWTLYVLELALVMAGAILIRQGRWGGPRPSDPDIE